MSSTPRPGATAVALNRLVVRQRPFQQRGPLVPLGERVPVLGGASVSGQMVRGAWG